MSIRSAGHGSALSPLLWPSCGVVHSHGLPDLNCALLNVRFALAGANFAEQAQSRRTRAHPGALDTRRFELHAALSCNQHYHQRTFSELREADQRADAVVPSTTDNKNIQMHVLSRLWFASRCCQQQCLTACACASLPAADSLPPLLTSGLCVVT